MIVACVLLGQLLGLVGRSDAWMGSWRQTEAHIAGALVLSAPVAAAVAAWVAATERRRGLTPMVAAASRPPWRVRLRVVAETWAWSAAGAVAAGAVALGATATSAVYGYPSAWPWLPVLASLLLACAAGASLARWLPPVLAPLVAGSGAYVLIGLADIRAHSILAAVTPLDGRGMAFFTVPWWIHTLQAVSLGALGVALVLWTGGRGRQAFLAAWLAGVVAAPLLLLGFDDRRLDESSTALECSAPDGGLSVCLPAAKAHLAGDLRMLAGEVWSLVEGLAPHPAVVVDDEARGLSAGVDRELREVAVAVRGSAATPVYLSGCRTSPPTPGSIVSA